MLLQLSMSQLPVHLQTIEDVYVDHSKTRKSSKSDPTKVTFCVKTCDRNYFLMAPSPEAMRIWVDVVFSGAQGHLDQYCQH